MNIQLWVVHSCNSPDRQDVLNLPTLCPTHQLPLNPLLSSPLLKQESTFRSSLTDRPIGFTAELQTAGQRSPARRSCYCDMERCHFDQGRRAVCQLPREVITTSRGWKNNEIIETTNIPEPLGVLYGMVFLCFEGHRYTCWKHQYQLSIQQIRRIGEVLKN